MSQYRVWGLDPASSKASTVFTLEATGAKEPGFQSYKRAELATRLCSTEPSSGFGPRDLLCWDAPLTGSPDPDLEGSSERIEEHYTGDLCTRVIEKYFGGGTVNWCVGAGKQWTHRFRPSGGEPSKAPPGISVRGYAGLTHWTISRRLLGLPRVGRYDQPLDQLPARLLTEETTTPPPVALARPSVVEVHPGLALWLWLRPPGRYTPPPSDDTQQSTSDDKNAWQYKKSQQVLDAMWRDLRAHLLGTAGHIGPIREGVERVDAHILGASFSDDHLDAFVAWALGILWVHQDPEDPRVTLFGDRRVGAMLLPGEDLVGEDLGADFGKQVRERWPCN